MNPRRIVLTSALALLLAHSAQATPIDLLDTLTGQTTAGADGWNNGVSEAAVSFTSPMPGSFVVQLLLSASAPSDGGSFGVYLVPDTGSGAGPGMAGAPGAISGSQLIATVADSTLSTTEAVQRFDVTSTISTANNEYWVALVTNAGSSVDWSWNSGSGYVGAAGQEYYNTTGGVDTITDSPYSATVAAPEPADLAVLGIGLIGLSIARRRHTVG
jgi:hypothetical protein